MAEFEKKVWKLIKETKTPFAQIAVVLGMRDNLLRYHINRVLTSDHQKLLKAWAADQAKKFRVFSE